jgi:hypothetical protein
MSAKLKLVFTLMATLMATMFAIPPFGQPSFGQAGAPLPQDKTVVVLGQTLHCWDVGSGPILVLVHGLGSKKENDWGRAVGPLSRNIT